ncbi:MAG: PD-(D/E)XK nuclease family protein, partial [Pseudomonadota bacterium]
DSEEALLAAIMLRRTLEHPDETAALITPDAGLARRVSAMMKRWNVDVSTSAGAPLAQTPAGSLVLLTGEWLQDPSHPVALMALLNHPSVQFDIHAIRHLDKHVLRGPRVWSDWPTLIEHAHALKSDTGRRGRAFKGAVADQALGLLEDLSAIVDQASRLDEDNILGEDWYRNLSETAAALCRPPRPWAGEDGAAIVRVLRELADLAGPLGEQPPGAWLEILQTETSLQAIPAGNPHPKLAIWGPLEARLQSADHLILAGLNEGIWPEQPPADGFLPRVFRNKIGLPDPDERIGLSAHDFAQFATSPRVTLLQSRRRDDKPAIASRWVWRLRTLVRGALGSEADMALGPDADADPRAWLAQIERAPPLPGTFTAEPRPKPPLAARPKNLSVTRIEQLIRDPYAIYCEHILNLEALDPLNLPPDVRVRGTAIHKALERFELELYNTAEELLTLIEHELRSGGEVESEIIALRDQRFKVCQDYLDWRSAQVHEIEGAPLTEDRGSITISAAANEFMLSGTADRIERRIGNKIAILDFKTGKPPSEKQVRSGLSPQMPLQGLIARSGGYGKLGTSEVTALTYLRFGTQFQVQELGASGQKGR